MTPAPVTRTESAYGEGRVGPGMTERRGVVVGRVGVVAAVAELGEEASVVPVERIVVREGARDKGDVAGHLYVDVAVESVVGAGRRSGPAADVVAAVAEEDIGVLAVPRFEE